MKIIGSSSAIIVTVKIDDAPKTFVLVFVFETGPNLRPCIAASSPERDDG
jgi:hypothetical protein